MMAKNAILPVQLLNRYGRTRFPMFYPYDNLDDTSWTYRDVLDLYNDCLSIKDIEALTAEYEASIADLIVKNEEKIRTSESEENIQTIELEESKIVSPVDGVIKTLEIGTEGGVLTPAQIVATVVPSETSMQAEVDVLN